MFSSIKTGSEVPLEGVGRYKIQRRNVMAFIACSTLTILFFLLIGSDRLLAAENEKAASGDAAPSSQTSVVNTVSSDMEEADADFMLPKIYEVSISLIYPGEGDKKDQLTASIKNLLVENGEKEAARTLGEMLGLQRKNSKAYL
ncbi:MAG: hypothetical protein WCY94_02735, partial [Synergistaceae bacterium]